MKIKDIKEALEFLNKNGMEGVKEALRVLIKKCPNDIDLVRAGSCFCTENCLKCWEESLELKVNEDKLENEIKED